jgi:hypothetical protein
MATPTPPLAAVTPAKISFWQTLEAWFHHEAVVVEDDIKKILNSSEVQALETGFTALLKSDLGKLALEAVTAAASIETGTVSFTAAYNTLVAGAKALGKELTDSTITTLIAAAQQKLQSTLGIKTVPTK